MPGRLSAVAAVAAVGFGVGFAVAGPERPAPDAAPALSASLVNEVGSAAPGSHPARFGRAAAIPALRPPKANRRSRLRPSRERAATRAATPPSPTPAAAAVPPPPAAAPPAPATAAPAPAPPRPAPRKPPVTFDTSG